MKSQAEELQELKLSLELGLIDEQEYESLKLELGEQSKQLNERHPLAKQPTIVGQENVANPLAAQPTIVDGDTQNQPTPDTYQLPTGFRLGQYEVITRIGQGAMGIVYRARHVMTEFANRTGDVAIKLLPDWYVQNQYYRDCFVEEAMVGRELNHPNLVRIYDVLSQQQMLGLVMDYVDGGTMAAQLTHKPLLLDDCLSTITALAAALDYLHTKGIIHRDFKLENILMTSTGVPVIADFGIAARSDSAKGEVVGTPIYMSPEQINGEPADAASDRYAFGVLIYRMLTGVFPWDEGQSIQQLRRLKLQEEIIPAHQSNPEIGIEVSDVISRMLSLEPQKRFKTCVQFIEVLNVANDKDNFVFGQDFPFSSPFEQDSIEEESMEEGPTINELEPIVEEAEQALVDERAPSEEVIPETPISEETTGDEVEFDFSMDIFIAEEEPLEPQQEAVAEPPSTPQVEPSVTPDISMDIDSSLADEPEVEEPVEVKQPDIRSQREIEFAALKEEIKKTKKQRDVIRREHKEKLKRYKHKLGEFRKAAKLKVSEQQRIAEAAEKSAAGFFGRMFYATKAKEARASWEVAKIQCKKETEAAEQEFFLSKSKLEEELRRDSQSLVATLDKLRRRAKELHDEIASLDGEDRFTFAQKKPFSISKLRVSGQSFSMVLIPMSSYNRGALPDDRLASKDEKPRHQVVIDRSFWIAQEAVTQGLYEAIMSANPSRFQHRRKPVEQVSWTDAVYFCNQLSELLELEPFYHIPENFTPQMERSIANELAQQVTANWAANGFRLPTEAEWEFAARSPSGESPEQFLYAGADAVDEVAWFRANSSSMTQVVGHKKANHWGIFDMSGNVWEWCWDWKAQYQSGSFHDPDGAPTGKEKAIRGGCYFDEPQNLRSSTRLFNYPGHTSDRLGFRLVRTA